MSSIFLSYFISVYACMHVCCVVRVCMFTSVKSHCSCMYVQAQS